eukprot:TRINITY_DN6794_c0_g1_i1.p1 TRINITY_DN6794_c0_g1~~TRINITY_DN6794_c0_g1_i1.p1  ORF type:complete len:149 (+),score=42.22 TRINITY_DN6794_c0_g1_i1:69-449(+)
MALNDGPDWFRQSTKITFEILASYGWFLLVGFFLIWWLYPKVERLILDKLAQNQAQGAAAALKFVEEEKLARQRQLERIAQQKKEAEEEKKRKQEELRAAKLEELRKKEERLGLRPRGVPHRLGTE